MIYVHIPFCTSKCHFCDWVQAIPKGDLLLKPADDLRRRYIAALVSEICARGRALTAAGYVPYVLYWGGGTASALDEFEAEAVMTALRESFDLNAVAESTIECSPETVSLEKLRWFRQLGFDRFSSGVQSLQSHRLRVLGRSHSAEQAVRVVQFAREAGFAEVNIDLMCGFADEEPSEVEDTVGAALSLPISHLSIYPFRPTPGTQLRRKMREEDTNGYLRHELMSFARARRIARSAGLSEYAVGYFGAPALNVVMPFQVRLETIGFGSGAISLLDGMYYGHNKGLLREYIADPMRWDFASPAAAPSVAFSLLRSGLSIYDGLQRKHWLDRTGVPLDAVLAEPTLAPIVAYLREKGKLVEDEAGIRLPESTAPHVIVELAFRGSMGQPQARVVPLQRRAD